MILAMQTARQIVHVEHGVGEYGIRAKEQIRQQQKPNHNAKMMNVVPQILHVLNVMVERSLFVLGFFRYHIGHMLFQVGNSLIAMRFHHGNLFVASLFNAQHFVFALPDNLIMLSLEPLALVFYALIRVAYDFRLLLCYLNAVLFQCMRNG